MNAIRIQAPRPGFIEQFQGLRLPDRVKDLGRTTWGVLNTEINLPGAAVLEEAIVKTPGGKGLSKFAQSVGLKGVFTTKTIDGGNAQNLRTQTGVDIKIRGRLAVGTEGVKEVATSKAARTIGKVALGTTALVLLPAAPAEALTLLGATVPDLVMGVSTAGGFAVGAYRGFKSNEQNSHSRLQQSSIGTGMISSLSGAGFAGFAGAKSWLEVTSNAVTGGFMATIPTIIATAAGHGIGYGGKLALTALDSKLASKYQNNISRDSYSQGDLVGLHRRSRWHFTNTRYSLQELRDMKTLLEDNSQVPSMLEKLPGYEKDRQKLINVIEEKIQNHPDNTVTVNGSDTSIPFIGGNTDITGISGITVPKPPTPVGKPTAIEAAFLGDPRGNYYSHQITCCSAEQLSLIADERTRVLSESTSTNAQKAKIQLKHALALISTTNEEKVQQGKQELTEIIKTFGANPTTDDEKEYVALANFALGTEVSGMATTPFVKEYLEKQSPLLAQVEDAKKDASKKRDAYDQKYEELRIQELDTKRGESLHELFTVVQAAGVKTEWNTKGEWSRLPIDTLETELRTNVQSTIPDSGYNWDEFNAAFANYKLAKEANALADNQIEPLRVEKEAAVQSENGLSSQFNKLLETTWDTHFPADGAVKPTGSDFTLKRMLEIAKKTKVIEKNIKDTKIGSVMDGIKYLLPEYKDYYLSSFSRAKITYTNTDGTSKEHIFDKTTDLPKELKSLLEPKSGKPRILIGVNGPIRVVFEKLGEDGQQITGREKHDLVLDTTGEVIDASLIPAPAADTLIQSAATHLASNATDSEVLTAKEAAESSKQAFEASQQELLTSQSEERNSIVDKPKTDDLTISSGPSPTSYRITSSSSGIANPIGLYYSKGSFCLSCFHEENRDKVRILSRDALSEKYNYTVTDTNDDKYIKVDYGWSLSSGDIIEIGTGPNAKQYRFVQDSMDIRLEAISAGFKTLSELETEHQIALIKLEDALEGKVVPAAVVVPVTSPTVTASSNLNGAELTTKAEELLEKHSASQASLTKLQKAKDALASFEQAVEIGQAPLEEVKFGTKVTVFKPQIDDLKANANNISNGHYLFITSDQLGVKTHIELEFQDTDTAQTFKLSCRSIENRELLRLLDSNGNVKVDYNDKIKVPSNTVTKGFEVASNDIIEIGKKGSTVRRYRFIQSADNPHEATLTLIQDSNPASQPQLEEQHSALLKELKQALEKAEQQTVPAAQTQSAAAADPQLVEQLRLAQTAYTTLEDAVKAAMGKATTDSVTPAEIQTFLQIADSGAISRAQANYDNLVASVKAAMGKAATDSVTPTEIQTFLQTADAGAISRAQTDYNNLVDSVKAAMGKATTDSVTPTEIQTFLQIADSGAISRAQANYDNLVASVKAAMGKATTDSVTPTEIQAFLQTADSGAISRAQIAYQTLVDAIAQRLDKPTSEVGLEEINTFFAIFDMNSTKDTSEIKQFIAANLGIDDVSNLTNEQITQFFSNLDSSALSIAQANYNNLVDSVKAAMGKTATDSVTPIEIQTFLQTADAGAISRAQANYNNLVDSVKAAMGKAATDSVTPTEIQTFLQTADSGAISRAQANYDNLVASVKAAMGKATTDSVTPAEIQTFLQNADAGAISRAQANYNNLLASIGAKINKAADQVTPQDITDFFASVGKPSTTTPVTPQERIDAGKYLQAEAARKIAEDKKTEAESKAAEEEKAKKNWQIGAFVGGGGTSLMGILALMASMGNNNAATASAATQANGGLTNTLDELTKKQKQAQQQAAAA